MVKMCKSEGVYKYQVMGKYGEVWKYQVMMGEYGSIVCKYRSG